jgi:hypothetical protein
MAVKEQFWLLPQARDWVVHGMGVQELERADHTP